jgi:hypothetical protein
MPCINCGLAERGIQGDHRVKCLSRRGGIESLAEAAFMIRGGLPG